jgi:hypothetical protein
VLITINQLNTWLERGVIETAPNTDWLGSRTAFTGGDSVELSTADDWSSFSMVVVVLD